MEQRKMIICRCEEVTLGELLDTAKAYNCSSREIKLRTRAGMGYCGGRTCRHLIDSIIEDTNVGIISHEVPLKYQPPVRPISFNCFGGSFHE
jgi:NAD(P)H-nitrite reductase large subunit